MAKLAVFVVGAALLAGVVRVGLGAERIARHRVALSGLTVVLLLLFGIAVMDGMTQHILAEPGTVLLYAAVALGASAALQGLSFLVFCRLERGTALTAGLIGGNHNLAIVWATLPAPAANALLLFFALVQLPIFVLPAALKPIYLWLGARPRNTSPEDE